MIFFLVKFSNAFGCLLGQFIDQFVLQMSVRLAKEGQSRFLPRQVATEVLEKSAFSSKGIRWSPRIFSLAASESASSILNVSIVSGYVRNGEKRHLLKLAMAVCATCVVPPACAKQPGSSNATPSDTPHTGCRRHKFSTSSDVVSGGSATLQFFITWHTPRVHFRSALVAYRR